MITLLSTLFGVIGGVLPNVVKLMERQQDHKYELELTKLKIDAATKGLEFNAIAESAKADVEEGKSLRDHDSSLDSVGMLETLRASIRPVLTYFFFFLFCGIKISVAYVMLSKGHNPTEIINAVWDQSTMAIFATILAFWFGNRAMIKFYESYEASDKKRSKK